MDTPPRNLMNAWRAWNAYHRKVIRDDPQDFNTKLKLRRFRKRISVDWKKIGKLYPNDHEARKMRFYQRIRRLKRVEQATQRASDRKHDYPRRDMATSVNNDLEPHENYLKWLNQSLLHLRGLIRFERRVLGGQRDEPAEHILAYDLRKVRHLKQRISANSRRLAQARLRHEGTIPGNRDATPPNRQPSRSWYQKLGQPHRNIDHLRGGRMFYVHVHTNSQTTAACWVLTDGHNNIADRVVAKDAWDIREFNSKWESPLYWFGDPTDPTAKQPHEALIQEKLVHESILGIRSWHLHANKLMCRFLLEYCPYGDAMDLCHRYRTRWLSHGRRAEYMIPEPAIWHMFETLIKAGLVMEQGDVDQPMPGWNDVNVGGPVVHMDLKLDNLFIGDYPDQSGDDGEDPDNFAMYPAFKVADFGYAIDDRCRHPPGDDSYRGRGTEGYVPPDQMQFFPGQNQDPLNTKTNVWGVGIILMTMMNFNGDTGDLTFEEAATDERDPNLVPRFSDRAVNKYSLRLRTMVLRCVRFRQHDRPTFDTLLTGLRISTNMPRGLHHNQRDYAAGARHATTTNLPGNLRLLDFVGTDRYALGLTLVPTQALDGDSA